MSYNEPAGRILRHSLEQLIGKTLSTEDELNPFQQTIVQCFTELNAKTAAVKQTDESIQGQKEIEIHYETENQTEAEPDGT